MDINNWDQVALVMAGAFPAAITAIVTGYVQYKRELVQKRKDDQYKHIVDRINRIKDILKCKCDKGKESEWYNNIREKIFDGLHVFSGDIGKYVFNIEEDKIDWSNERPILKNLLIKEEELARQDYLKFIGKNKK